MSMLWEISDQYMAAFQKYLDDPDSEVLRHELEAIGDDLQTKAENTAKYIDHLERQAETHKRAAEQQIKKTKRCIEHANRLRRGLVVELGALPAKQRNQMGGVLGIVWNDAKPSVDETRVDMELAKEKSREFLIMPDRPPMKPDKKAVLAYRKSHDGAVPPGFEDAIVYGEPGVQIR